jgi:hypothetical protein
MWVIDTVDCLICQYGLACRTIEPESCFMRVKPNSLSAVACLEKLEQVAGGLQKVVGPPAHTDMSKSERLMTGELDLQNKSLPNSNPTTDT